MNQTPKIAFIFPGQGESHSVGMAKDFYEAFQVAKNLFEQASDLTKVNLKKLIFEGPLETLSKTNHCQLAIYLVSMVIYEVLKERYPDLKPDFVGGLSLGEYSAATAAGVLSFEQGVQLVHARGSYMQKACEENPSTMAVVLGFDEAQVREVLNKLNLPNQIWIANLNCPGQIVVSGSHAAIETFVVEAKLAGAKRALPLNVAGAFHTPFMGLAANELQNRLQSMTIQAPTVPFYMNSVGKQVESLDEVRSLLIKQITSSVRWQDCIEAMNRDGANLFLEIGPGKVLAGLNKRIKVSGETHSIHSVSQLDLLTQYSAAQ